MNGNGDTTVVSTGYMTMREARDILGCSYAKLREFARLGLLHPESDPFDKRLKVVKVTEVKDLERSRKSPKSNRQAA